MIHSVVPPQNHVDRTIVDVSALEIKLTYPDASLALRPTRLRSAIEEARPKPDFDGGDPNDAKLEPWTSPGLADT